MHLQTLLSWPWGHIRTAKTVSANSSVLILLKASSSSEPQVQPVLVDSNSRRGWPKSAKHRENWPIASWFTVPLYLSDVLGSCHFTHYSSLCRISTDSFTVNDITQEFNLFLVKLTLALFKGNSCQLKTFQHGKVFNCILLVILIWACHPCGRRLRQDLPGFSKSIAEVSLEHLISQMEV